MQGFRPLLSSRSFRLGRASACWGVVAIRLSALLSASQVQSREMFVSLLQPSLLFIVRITRASSQEPLSLACRWTNDAKDGMADCFSCEGLQRRVGSGIEVWPHDRDVLEVLLEHGRTLLWAELDDRHGF